MEVDLESLEQGDMQRQRRLATLLLVLMAAIFVATHSVADPAGWVLLLRASAEAGLVGGLADWFAVTALFRRPLGLPIPHTAIIVRNKERIGAGLGRFIDRNFLSPDLIASKLRGLDPARGLAEWLVIPENSRLAADHVVRMLPRALHTLDRPPLRRLFRREVRRRLRGEELQPWVGQVLRSLWDSEYYRSSMHRLLVAARALLLRHEKSILSVVAERRRWWVPRRVDRHVAESVVQALEELLDGLAEPEHPLRQEFDRSVSDLIDRL